MNHPNVLKLYGFFHDAKNIYLILEYCNKCLFRELRQKVIILLKFRENLVNNKPHITLSSVLHH
jgi:serine/threonine protein kinase